MIKKSFAGRMAVVLIFGTFSKLQAEVISTPFHSPSGHFDLVFDTVAVDWTHMRHEIKGAAKESQDLYTITIYAHKSDLPVNVIYYADIPPTPSPTELMGRMLWSPHEEYIVLEEKQNAHEGTHRFQLVAPLNDHKVWSLEADHVQWLDDRRFIGDLNTQDVPGGIMQFDTHATKVELLIPADEEIGYRIVSLTGRVATIRQFLNKVGHAKTTWESFIPACFDLDLDTMKKKSVPCASSK